MENKIINSEIYGKCLELKSKDVVCLISIDKGPRILYYGIDKNLLFEDKEDFINKVRDDLNIENNVWHIYGGHRLWKAPEDTRTYYPDNKDCIVEELNNSYIRITADKEIDTKLQKSFEVKLDDDGSLLLRDILKREKNREEAAWSLTVFKPHGDIIIPLSQKDTGYLPNRSIVLWPYTKLNDKRIDINDRRIHLIIEKEEVASKDPLKIGTFSDDRVIYYLKDDLAVEVSTSYISKSNSKFPDNNCNVEVYTINKMVELELLTNFEKRKKEIVIESKFTIYRKDSDKYKQIKNMI